MKTKAIIATFIVVVITGILIRFFFLTPTSTPANEEQKTTESSVVEKESGKDVVPTIEASKTIVPTETVKPTLTVTVKVTKTPEPTPTEYLRNPNPTNSTQEMENKICKIYGKQDCQTVIKWAEAENVRLSPTFQMSSRNGLGVLALDCNYSTKKLLAKDTMTDDEFLNYCRSIVFDADTNIRIPLELYKTKGITAVEEYLRFGTVK